MVKMEVSTGSLQHDVIYERMAKGDAESILIGYVKRAYFDYRKAT